MKGYGGTLDACPDHLAVIDGERRLTYRRLHERASRLAHALTDAGVGFEGTDDDRLGVMLPNSAEFVECLAASAKLGAASLTVNWHLRPDELAWIIDDSGIAGLVTHHDLRPHVEEVAAKRSLPVVWVGDDYEARMAAAPSATLPYRWPTSWPVLYTSGTSGRPKGVVHGGTADPAVMAMAQDGLSALWDYRADDVHLAAGPLYHAGPAGYANTTLYVGGTVVTMGTWDPDEFFELVERHRVTTTFLTPAHFIRLLESGDEAWSAHDLSSLRHVIHAGAPCPRPVKERITAALAHVEIWELYGMSEGGATRASVEDWRQRPGTVGRPWPGVELRIVDPVTGDELPAGTDGLVYVKPPWGRFRYYNDPQKTAEAWLDDAFTVGDIGHLDDDGYLYLTDRQSDMIIRAGVNVYPREVEEALHQHPAVVDCAVFGVPDDRDGEQPRAVVEARSAVSEDDLHAFLRDRLDPYKCPTSIELVDELERDPNGKVLKRRLRERAWAGSGRHI